MSRRRIGRLVEEQLMDCHDVRRARRLAAGPLVLPDELRQDDRRDLDDAVFELLGVRDAAERAQIVQRLHEVTALHFRQIRVVEIEKQEQRASTANRRFNVVELAADAWDAAELPDLTPLAEWVGKQPGCDASVNIPDERPAELSPSPMFDPNTVYFGRRRAAARKREAGASHDDTPALHVECASNGQAKLIVYLANVGLSGWVNVPADEAACLTTLRAVETRLQTARRRFEQLADSRTSDPSLQAQIVDQLMRWFISGRSKKTAVAADAGDEPADDQMGRSAGLPDG